MADLELQNRVVDAAIVSHDYIQIHQHIDGKCAKSYAYWSAEDAAYLHVIANERGEVLEVRPITSSLPEWALSQVEAHALKCSRERIGVGNA